MKERQQLERAIVVELDQNPQTVEEVTVVISSWLAGVSLSPTSLPMTQSTSINSQFSLLSLTLVAGDRR